MTQPTFWNGAGEIHVDGQATDTRAAAATAIAPLAGGMARRVLEFIRSRGDRGATDEEISLALAMRDSTARARRVELRDAEKIRDSMRRRATKSGRLSIVWVAAAQLPEAWHA